MLPGSSELLLIFGVAVLLFGPSKLPQLGKAVGEGIKNFKKGLRSDEEEAAPSSTQTDPSKKRIGD